MQPKTLKPSGNIASPSFRRDQMIAQANGTPATKTQPTSTIGKVSEHTRSIQRLEAFFEGLR